jgi:flagellar protein FlaG
VVSVDKPDKEVIQEMTAVNAENIDTAVNNLNNIVQNIQRDLNFRVEEESGKVIVTVLDSKTEEVIRQIPAEHVLAISENIENLKGILFSARV